MIELEATAMTSLGILTGVQSFTCCPHAEGPCRNDMNEERRTENFLVPRLRPGNEDCEGSPFLILLVPRLLPIEVLL